jgi:hypothetical protein
MIEVPLLCLQSATAVRHHAISNITVGLIYGGMETSGDNNGVIGVWNATDLTLVKYVFTTQNGFPWLACNCCCSVVQCSIEAPR